MLIFILKAPHRFVSRPNMIQFWGWTLFHVYGTFLWNFNFFRMIVWKFNSNVLWWKLNFHFYETLILSESVEMLFSWLIHCRIMHYHRPYWKKIPVPTLLLVHLSLISQQEEIIHNEMCQNVLYGGDGYFMVIQCWLTVQQL